MEVPASDITMEAGYAAVVNNGERMRKCDSLFAMNDLMAIGAIFALNELGLRVPQDVGVIGYDDTELAAGMRPSLTTIHQPREELSLATCERLLQLIGSRRAGGTGQAGTRRILAPTISLRETC